MKYCNQIGIVEKPILVKDRKQMHAILVNAGKPKRCAGWGQCFWDLNTIFVDTGLRIHYPSRRYKGVTFRYLQHGWKFEKRINEILRGRTFEPKPIKNEPKPKPKPKKEYNGTLDFFL